MAERTYLVVVGYNATESGDLALLRAIEMARSRNAELHVVHVEDVTPAVLHLPKDVTVRTMDLAALRHQTAWERAAALLDARDPATRVDLEGSPAKAIVSYCDDVGADLL
ncbi:MAG: universal stress protein, partial [Acidobacteria bacterium]|nr:universal stress protein [Acidobacteriota bacterium]